MRVFSLSNMVDNVVVGFSFGVIGGINGEYIMTPTETQKAKVSPTGLRFWVASLAVY
jgi:hypothetical protein